MEDTLVSYSTAKLAKEKGFNEKCRHIGREELYENDELTCTPEELSLFGNWTYSTNGACAKNDIMFSTQSLLQKWIREIHNIHIVIGLSEDGYILVLEEDCDDLEGRENTEFDSYTIYEKYEEALERGLYESLKLINIELEKR